MNVYRKPGWFFSFDHDGCVDLVESVTVCSGGEPSVFSFKEIVDLASRNGFPVLSIKPIRP